MKKPPSVSSTRKTAMAALMLRLGLAAVFAYAAIDALLEPAAWLSFVPPMASHFVSATTALDLISVAQLVLVALLLIGKYLRVVSLISAAFLAGSVVFNLGSLLITFRDIGLVATALSLYLLSS